MVKKWAKLRSEKDAREEHRSVLLAGEKMIRDLSKHISLQALITERPASEIPAQERYLVNADILRKITGVSSPDGFAAVAELPKPQSLAGKQRIVVLDRIADPGNLGTILRTALAMNWDGVLFTPQTVDPFNDKALRASKGALFFLPFAWEEGEAFLQKARSHAYVADLEGLSLSEVSAHPPLALILSNEGAGPSQWTEKLAKKISIPMHNDVESLNVAASGAILLYAMRPK
ncbi:MAG TPA: RNA methyltransferase [Chlamydiales bacterium]|nr:RNA methyltransferase [Chlamydiales bacterium]